MKLNIEHILFQDIDPKSFYEEYWNKKPLLIRGALPQIKEWADASDLLDLASDPDVESHIVYNNGEDFEQSDGPIFADDLKGLYTFSCHGINLYHENFKQLELAMTKALPHWQFDDILTTVSNKGSTLGAHFDHYNVFIIQGHGKREWQLEYSPKQSFRKDQPVKLLELFNPDESFVLVPGDMLYIPPLCGHRGLSLDDSVSYSVGFKAFEFENLAKNYLLDFVETFTSNQFYRDSAPSNGYELQEDFFNYFKKELQDSLLKDDLLRSWLSSYLSSPKYPGLPNEETDDENLEANFDSKFNYYLRDETAHCYLNNFYFTCSAEELKQVKEFMQSFDVNKVTDKKLLALLVKAAALRS